MLNYSAKVRELEEEFARTQNKYQLNYKKKQLLQPMVLVVKRRVQAFNPAFFDIGDFIDHFFNRYDHFVLN